MKEMKQQLLQLLSYIPYGKVTSYGALANALDRHYGIMTSGWMVGRMLSNMPAHERKETTLPRWRVVNKQWVVSSTKLGEKGIDQIARLRAEWIEINDIIIDMNVYGIIL